MSLIDDLILISELLQYLYICRALHSTCQIHANRTYCVLRNAICGYILFFVMQEDGIYGEYEIVQATISTSLESHAFFSQSNFTQKTLTNIVEVDTLYMGHSC